MQNVNIITDIAQLETTFNLIGIDRKVSETLQLKSRLDCLITFIQRVSAFAAEPPDTSIKDVIKLFVNPKICDKLNKTSEINQSGITVNVFFRTCR